MSFFAPGTVVDETYTIIRQIGEGGMGRVYSAQEPGLERTVALKVLHPTLVGDQESQQRFFREGQVLATLSHPNITRLYRFGMWQQTWPYIAMEFVDGQSLRTLLLEQGKLPVDRCLKIISKVCEAMQSAHTAGVTHRDLTPNNIILTCQRREDGANFPKVIDFGLSLFQPIDKTTKQQLTGTGMLVGTVFYMSPEQCAGIKPDHRADIYSLGCILYQMVTGEAPFRADNPIGLMRKHTSERPDPLSHYLSSESIPEGLENVILRAMAKDPSKRYNSMKEMHSDLEKIRSGQGSSITAPPAENNSPASRKRSILPVCLALALLITLGAFAGLSKKQPGTMEDSTAQTSAPLRRLKSVENYSSPERKMQYLRSWLDHYGSSISYDSARARYLLACALRESQTDVVETNRYFEDAAAIAKQVFLSTWHKGNGEDANVAIVQLCRIRTDADKRSTLKKELLQLLPMVQTSQEVGLVKAINKIRTELAICCMDENDFKTATTFLTATLATAERFSMPSTERLHAMVRLCNCYKMEGDKAALVKELKAAYHVSERMVQLQGIADKVTLAGLFEGCAMPESCLDECKIVERCDLNELSGERLSQFFITKAKALVQLNRAADAYDYLSTKMIDAPPAVTFPLLETLIQLNATHNMHHTEDLIVTLERIVQEKKYQDSITEIMAAACQLENFCFLRNSIADCKRILADAALAAGRDNLPANLAASHLSTIATHYHRLNMYADAERIFERARRILDASGQLNYAARTAHDIGMANLLSAQNRFDEAIKLCDKSLAERPARRKMPELNKMEILLTKGRILLKQQKLDDAERTLTQYHDLCKSQKNIPYATIALIDLSTVPFKRHDYRGSERYLLEAMENSASAPPAIQQSALLALSDVYVHLNDDVKAARCLEKYVALNGPYSNRALNEIALRRYAAIEKRAGKSGKERELRSKLVLPET